MRKLFALFFVVTMLFTGCGSDVQAEPLNDGYTVDTLFGNSLTTDPVFREENQGTNAMFSYNADDKQVKYIRYDENNKPELEKYCTYHEDGRVYQDLRIFYENGEYDSSLLYQYEYEKNSTEAKATIWRSKGDIIGTHSVMHTMEDQYGEMRIVATYESSTEHILTVKIRGIETWYRVHGTYTEYYGDVAGYTTDITHEAVNRIV